MALDPGDVRFVEDGVPCLTQRTLRRYGPWHLIVGCLMLNQTDRRQARPALRRIFAMAPSPGAFLRADRARMREVLLPCGLADARGLRLRQMSEAYVAGAPPTRLPGLGPYAWDSYDIFINGALLHPEDVGDHSLRPYLVGAWEGRWGPDGPL